MIKEFIILERRDELLMINTLLEYKNPAVSGI